jgi:hypothetical protein
MRSHTRALRAKTASTANIANRYACTHHSAARATNTAHTGHIREVTNATRVVLLLLLLLLLRSAAALMMLKWQLRR